MSALPCSKRTYILGYWETECTVLLCGMLCAYYVHYTVWQCASHTMILINFYGHKAPRMNDKICIILNGSCCIECRITFIFFCCCCLYFAQCHVSMRFCFVCEIFGVQSIWHLAVRSIFNDHISFNGDGGGKKHEITLNKRWNENIHMVT